MSTFTFSNFHLQQISLSQSKLNIFKTNILDLENMLKTFVPVSDLYLVRSFVYFILKVELTEVNARPPKQHNNPSLLLLFFFFFFFFAFDCLETEKEKPTSHRNRNKT